jgi:hypothetical protein
MNRKLMLLSVALFGTATSAWAVVEADPSKDYPITPEVGGFTICAASFTGEMAGKQAHDLVLELRTDYHIAAYLFNRGSEQRRLQQEELQRKRAEQKAYLEKMGLQPDIPLRLPIVRIEDQYAVLVGGFRDMDAAHRELNRIKKLQPPRSVPRDIVTQDPQGVAAQKAKAQKMAVNPFTNSFVVANPTIPTTHTNAFEPDPLWKKMNADETFSLLNCRRPWTLAIKEYQATAVIEPASANGSLFDKLIGNNGAQQLAANAMNAHNLAEGLHKLGFEVYVLHTRSSSIVTIGGFDSPSDPRMPSVGRAIKSLQLGPRLDLFPEPLPMPVPKIR